MVRGRYSTDSTEHCSIDMRVSQRYDIAADHRTHTHIYTHTGLLRNLFIVIVIIIILFMIIIISLSLSHAVADPGVCERAKVDTYTRWCLDTGDRDLKGKEQKGFLGESRFGECSKAHPQGGCISLRTFSCSFGISESAPLPCVCVGVTQSRRR